MKYEKRNAYMLKGSLKERGYDWWWHQIVAVNDKTGELEPFFIEYYVINPGLSFDKPIFGQVENRKSAIKPSYAKILAGKWGRCKSQLHSYFPIKEFNASDKKMDVTIGGNIANENQLRGSVKVTKEETDSFPERMSDVGEMEWDLKILKKISYSVGYGASWLFRKLNLFEMYWHVQGVKTEYSGKIQYNGESYTVYPKSSFGYQDKNWGKDYTNPWIWLNCVNFRDENNKPFKDTILDIGGGNPKIMGIPIGKKILVAFFHEGRLYNFNFTRILFQKQKWDCRIDENNVYWDVYVENRTHALEVHFSCEKSGMVCINYENPDGEKNHNNLYNGGYSSGTVKLYKKSLSGKKEIVTCYGSLGGGEYGSY